MKTSTQFGRTHAYIHTHSHIYAPWSCQVFFYNGMLPYVRLLSLRCSVNHSMIAQNMQGVAVLIEFAKGTKLLKKIKRLPNFVSDEHTTVDTLPVNIRQAEDRLCYSVVTNQYDS